MTASLVIKLTQITPCNGGRKFELRCVCKFSHAYAAVYHAFSNHGSLTMNVMRLIYPQWSIYVKRDFYPTKDWLLSGRKHIGCIIRPRHKLRFATMMIICRAKSDFRLCFRSRVYDSGSVVLLLKKKSAGSDMREGYGHTVPLRYGWVILHPHFVTVNVEVLNVFMYKFTVYIYNV